MCFTTFQRRKPSEGKSLCDGVDATQVLPASEAENNDLVSYMLTDQNKASSQGPAGPVVAIALAINDAASEGNWVDDDGVAFTGWSNWFSFEPDNGSGFESQNYGSMTNAPGQVYGKWFDTSDQPTNVVCHKPFVAPATTTVDSFDDSDFERPDLCSELSDNYINCWAPSGRFETQNATEGFIQTNTDGQCGFQWQGGSLVNKTCTITTIAGANFEAGNAAFVAVDTKQLVGFDLSGDINIVQSWDIAFDFEQDFNEQLDAYVAAVNEANKYNTTLPEEFSYTRTGDCGFNGADVTGFTPPVCTDSNPDGTAYTGFAIMVTNQHAGDANNNYAIANTPGMDSTFTVTLNVACPNGVTAHDANAWTVTVVDTTICQFTVDVLNGRAELFYFQGETVPLVDFFNVEIQ